MEKKIYIVLSQTGTMLSKALKFFTQAEFNHASISLSPKLDKMYSFGRLNPYNPFIGGFVEEGINKGTFKRFANTKAMVLEINVSIAKFKAIESNQFCRSYAGGDYQLRRRMPVFVADQHLRRWFFGYECAFG